MQSPAGNEAAEMLAEPSITPSSIPNTANTSLRMQAKSCPILNRAMIPHSDQKAGASLAADWAGKIISLKLLMSLECTNEDCTLIQPDREGRT